MSEQDLQVIEDAEEVLETPEEISDDEDLLEFKADHSGGGPVKGAEVEDPKTKKTDEKKKGKGDKMEKLKAVKESMPNTKAGMINAMVQAMTNMRKDELSSGLDGMLSAMYGSDTEQVEEDVVADISAKPLAKISSDDIDVADDVDAIFKGSELDDEFKEKISTIFEAAVVAKVNDQIEKFAIEAESDVEVATTEIVDDLTEKVDSYLDYVVQEWVESNKLAIDNGVRADMVEDFMRGLKDLFTEHYVDIPEEKVDVIDELISKVDDLENKLNETTDKNVELIGKVKEFEKEAVFADNTENLTDIQIEKLRGLAEGVDFIDSDDFKKKIDMLKAQYFNIDEETTEQVVTDDENDPISLDTEETEGPTGPMAHYMDAISRSAKK